LPSLFPTPQNAVVTTPQMRWTIMWSAIFNAKMLIDILVMAFITVLAILLNSAAIEEQTELDANFDKELFTCGCEAKRRISSPLRTVTCVCACVGALYVCRLGNFLGGFLGSFVGYSSVSKTMLCYSMGGSHRAGLFASAYYFAFWLLFFGVARFIPLPVLGAFICAIGLELIIEWTWHMRHHLNKEEMYEVSFLFLVMMYSFVGGFVSVTTAPLITS
jgi:MFS superfamily sulfate permease-like transporter